MSQYVPISFATTQWFFQVIIVTNVFEFGASFVVVFRYRGTYGRTDRDMGSSWRGCIRDIHNSASITCERTANIAADSHSIL
jgi:hypothetical protein